MISVVLGAAIALTLASIVLLIDWERIREWVRLVRGRRQYANAAARRLVIPPAATLDDPEWPTVFEGPGFKVVADGTVDVSARSYANGSTQVWLKRTAA